MAASEPEEGSAAGAAEIEVVYALADEQRVVTLALEPGLTAAGAVARSGLAEAFPEIAERELVLGIYGTRVASDRLLEAGDRVEICRPLELDPRDLRRELLKHGRVMGGAGQAPARRRD